MTRGPRPFWRIVAPALVGVALVSMLVVATVSYVVTSELDEERSLEQLGELQRSRSQAITDGLELRRQAVAILAADRSVSEALVEFRDALDLLDDPGTAVDGTGATDAQRTVALERNAERLVEDPALRSVVAATGLPIPTVADLVPDTAAARYLQYHYTLAGDRTDRLALDDPGDGSRYSQLHARHHPTLRELALDAGFQDLLLASLDGNRIVYTASKNPDLGVDAVTSVFGADGFGETLADVLPRTAVGETVLVDVQPYLGTAGRPVMFMAAAVRDDHEIVGALIAQLPVDRLNQLMTAGRQWREAGLGDTGQTYVVGRDLRLRSDLRTFLEDPAAHLRALRDAGVERADAVEAAGSTVLTQTVDTAAVSSALDGESFAGTSTTNHDGTGGTSTLAVAAPLDVVGLDWVVVAEIERSEAMAESREMLTELLVLAAILLPAVAVVGLVLARQLVRPVRPLVEAAEHTSTGGGTGPTDPGASGLDVRSLDEFGHLARELRSYTEMLAADDDRLAEERRAIDELLLAVLPARVIDAVRSGDLELGDLVDTATVIAVGIDGVTDEQSDPRSNERFAELAAALEARAAHHDVERVWSSADRHLFVAGLGRDHHGCDQAVQFLIDAREILAAHLPDHGITIGAAVAAGTVTTGVVGGEQIAFGMWGEPTRVALGLASVAEHGQVLVHASVSERLEVAGLLDGTTVTVDLGDGPIEVARLRDRAPAT